jgi:sulfopyruvate decarboxylase subunit beta
MQRSDILKEVAVLEGLLVANLGYTSRELYAVADSPKNFYMLGSMGLASSVGLGIALGQKKRVYVIDGDGSVLMNLGSLATIAHHAPPNYCLIIIDDKGYTSTGKQPTYTAKKTDLVAIAKAAGNEHVSRVKNLIQLRSALNQFSNDTSIIVAEAEPYHEAVSIIPYSPIQIKERFTTMSSRIENGK